MFIYIHNINTYIIYIVLANEEDEEHRVVSARLFNALAPNIGRELCEIYIIPTIASFAEDTNSKVRKAVVSNFLEMCKSISKETFKRKMIPVFEKLSHDSLWIVRRSAVSIIYEIGNITTDDRDRKMLIEIFRYYTQDVQKFVRHAALEVIGKFVNTLTLHMREQFILDFYIKSVLDFYQSREVASQADNEMIFNCAFNFPAMLLLYGVESWKDLKPCYLKMSTDKYFKVRKSLASSINEVSAILGKEETELVLIPIFDRFYREEGEIQKTIYRSMPKFLMNVQTEKRKTYLEKLKRLLRSREKWRTKKEYVEILGNLGGVFEDDLTFNQILPVCLNMCFDEVAEVRSHAAKSIKSLILHFICKEDYKERINAVLLSFARSLKYIYRLLFIYLTKEIVFEVDIVKEYFMENLELLSRDKIVNIQQAMALLVVEMVKSGKYNENDVFRTIVIRIKHINNVVINESFDEIKDNPFITSISSDDISSACIYESSNACFTNKMDIFKSLFNITQACIPHNSRSKFEKNESPKLDLVINESSENNEINECEDDCKSLSSASNQSNSDYKSNGVKDNEDENLINSNAGLVGKYFD